MEHKKIVKTDPRAIVHPEFSEAFKGFSKLNLQQRLSKLQEIGALTAQDLEFLSHGGLKDTSLGENFIENVIGYFQMPLGVATQFRIDGRDVVIPMAVEETSIVAAASKTAKWVRESGSITTELLSENIIGQIQIAKLKNEFSAREIIESHKQDWIKLANQEIAHGLVRRGGGVGDMSLRVLQRPDGFLMGVIHVLMNPVDAMGANLINQVCEFLKLPIEQALGEQITMCILSNLADTRLTKATVVIDRIDPELASKIEEASIFAETDPYRAATNNKGVMNGIDPILLATGNDWRAVEAGLHAYAVRDGKYSSITRWRRNGDQLVGELIAPIVVGTVGGVTSLHPAASMSLRMMGVTSASELSRLMAAVGLVQNLGALRALTTVGIIEGHMKLHIKNLSLGAGAKSNEIPLVSERLEQVLVQQKRISLSHAVDILREIRAQVQGN